MIEKIFYANSKAFDYSKIILLGVPDESFSHAKRKGASKGPDALREGCNKYERFIRNGKSISINPFSGTIPSNNILDIGNIKREELYERISQITKKDKIPVVFGGDHSITSLIIKAIGENIGKIGIIYFDAHPDFVTSERNYYGSVISDSLEHIDSYKSIFIGTRACEDEELKNLNENGFDIITPLDFLRYSIQDISKRIINRLDNRRCYISIDLDCLDPVFAPGVSVPTTCGITNLQLIYLVKDIIKNGIYGMDIVELAPDFDINDNTILITARLLSESLASMKF